MNYENFMGEKYEISNKNNNKQEILDKPEQII